jgi:hypothetical protein
MVGISLEIRMEAGGRESKFKSSLNLHLLLFPSAYEGKNLRNSKITSNVSLPILSIKMKTLY